MTQKKIVVDSTGQSVAANVRRFRGAANLSMYRFSELLKENGRHLAPDAISKIERGERRVDVDDLMALAVALQVAPISLLLPQDLRGDVTLTGAGTVPGRRAWNWAQGQAPLNFPSGPRERLAFLLRTTPDGVQVPRGEGA